MVLRWAVPPLPTAFTSVILITKKKINYVMMNITLVTS